MIFDIFLRFCLCFDHSYCNLGSDPLWPDVGPGDEKSTKKSKNQIFVGISTRSRSVPNLYSQLRKTRRRYRKYEKCFFSREYDRFDPELVAQNRELLPGAASPNTNINSTALSALRVLDSESVVFARKKHFFYFRWRLRVFRSRE